MLVHLTHPFVVGGGVLAVVVFLIFLAKGRASPKLRRHRLVKRNMSSAQLIAQRPTKNPVVDLCQCVSAISSLNSVALVADVQTVMRVTGTDPREIRQLLMQRIVTHAKGLGLSSHQFRNSTS